jgi:hypothetical protein
MDFKNSKTNLGWIQTQIWRWVVDFLSKLLQGIAFVPAIVNGIETLFHGRTGSEKRDAAMSFVSAALSLSDAVASHHIADEARFKEGMGKVIDGAVECLNASVWAAK